MQHTHYTHTLHACTIHTDCAVQAGRAALAVTQMAVTVVYRRAERDQCLLQQQEALVFENVKEQEVGTVLVPVLQEGTDLSTRRYNIFYVYPFC
jgi:hypothetical protein